MADLLQLIDDLTTKVTALAWALFLFTWTIGWTLRGAPLPFARLKRAGAGLIEDSIWAAFWLAIGTTVFKAILFISDLIAETIGL